MQQAASGYMKLSIFMLRSDSCFRFPFCRGSGTVWGDGSGLYTGWAAASHERRWSR